MQKPLLAALGITTIAMAMFPGCGETRELTFYLQDLQVRGPVSQPAVHITKNPEAGQITIAPSFWGATLRSSAGTIDGHSPVSSGGVFRVDTIRRSDNGEYFQDPGNVNTLQFGGTNLKWLYPSSGFGVDVDLGLSAAWALSLGATYSIADGKGLWGYRSGLGLRQHTRSLGLRFDFGWQWESVVYDATTVVTDQLGSGIPATVRFYRDRVTSSTGNFYAALTINGANPESAINPFLQLGITNQTLQDYKPSAPQQELWIVPPFFLVPVTQPLIVQDLRGKFQSTRIHFTPGVYLEFDPGVRLLIGTHVSIESGIENFSDPVLVSPFVQIEWTP